MTAAPPRFFGGFVRSVAVLASPAAAQEAWLCDLGDGASVDERALEFDNGFCLAGQWVEAGWLRNAAIAPLSHLDSILSTMSGEANADLWHSPALAERAEWHQVRTAALAALCAIR